MSLIFLFAIPLFTGLLALVVSPFTKRASSLPRWISVLGLLADLGLALSLWARGVQGAQVPWIAQFDAPWIAQWGVHFHLGLDGLSLVLIVLALFLGLVSVLGSGRVEKPGFFYLNLLWVLGGIIGVFLALDLFLFYFFWELMLIPMYFLIAIWGGGERIRAAVKFFIFTQAGGLLMLLSILGLYFAHGRVTGHLSFDYAELIGTPLSGTVALWLMLGFFAAFAVKLPVVPLHTWLPDAYSQAPTAGSIVLAGVLAKTGGYGLIRFVLPLFPRASHEIAPAAMALAIAGIIYSGILAFGQRDLKRLIAYSSVGHLAFVLLGIFAGTQLALQGAVLQMICHGLSIGGLFFLSGALEERLGTRDLRAMGGIASLAPKMSASAIFLALATLGLPGIGNFVGEFLTLLGTFQAHPVFGALAALGFVFSAIYPLWFIQAAFHGPQVPEKTFPDFSRRETALVGTIVAALLWIGVYPQPLLNATAAKLSEVGVTYGARAIHR